MLHPGLRGFGTIHLVSAVPGDIHPSISANGDMRPTDVARRNRAAGMAVHFYGSGESGSAISRAHIVEVAVGRFAGEIYHVQDALAIGHDLRLDSTVRYPNGAHSLNR